MPTFKVFSNASFALGSNNFILLFTKYSYIKFIFYCYFLFRRNKLIIYIYRMKKKISTLEGVPHLFDLIKVQDERKKLAFFVALRNTVS